MLVFGMLRSEVGRNQLHVITDLTTMRIDYIVYLLLAYICLNYLSFHYRMHSVIVADLDYSVLNTILETTLH